MDHSSRHSPAEQQAFLASANGATADYGRQRALRRWIRGSVLGHGLFGSVCVGRSLDGDGLLFAVKTAPLASAHQVSSLKNELQLLQSLESPHVIHCLGAQVSSIQHDPQFNLFLEYMPGGSLKDVIRKKGGKLDEKSAASCTRGILEGLCYLHNEGIVHSDIKTSNILLGSNGEIKIADFGTARKFSSSTGTASKHKLAGTPLWMAPEVLQGLEQGTSSDIWSLGCTLIEMLQGGRPWDGLHDDAQISFKDLESLLFRCSSGLIPPIQTSLSADAQDFLSKCLERDSAKRWTAKQLLQHPFVVSSEECLPWMELEELSPKSAFEFIDINELESEPDESMVEPHTVPGRKHRKQQHLLYNDRVWYTLKSAHDLSNQRHKPFFSECEGYVVKRGVEVSFESVGFLTKRLEQTLNKDINMRRHFKA
ncbi:hypothetical protein KP509_28G063100 [Ceratopteris richardii]|uniref:Protein kinase domain-containing protein n=1 Tax=Ceratopteris richardii TaxID=49495 RepID=A0A8T2REV2_CERRI|nr:hypothetical protein KP509_28G063100 [Ceratopteris richardii]